MIASALEGIDGIEIERDAPAGPFCTYRVGGPIRVLARVETPEALHQLAETIARTDGEPIATLPIGRGSNLLVACLLYTSPSPRDATLSRMPSSA